VERIEGKRTAVVPSEGYEGRRNSCCVETEWRTAICEEAGVGIAFEGTTDRREH